MHPVSLSFVDEEVERAYLRDAFSDYAGPLRVALIVGVALFAVYAAVDRYLFGHFVHEILVIRAVVCALGIGLLGLTAHHSFARWVRPAMSILHLAAGLGMIHMSILHPSYTGGVYAVLMFFALLARAQFRFSMSINGGLLLYLALTRATPDSSAGTIVDISMVFSAIVVIGLGAYVKERSDRLGFVRKQVAASARDRALAANRSKSTFLANMSHELRTPLNAIIGYGELLEEDVREAGLHESVSDVEKVVSAGKHLLGLINDILDLSKVEAGKVEISTEILDLADLVRSVCETVMPLVERNGNRFERTVAPELGTICSDPTRIRQILYNLLSNAAKFTRQGTVTLKVDREMADTGERVVFCVQDTGIGMSPDQLEHVFDAFSQADASTTRDYGGTGLGLTITRHFSQLLGGGISVTSAAGTGSEFTVWLPAQAGVTSRHGQP